jgi:hypothetical protein
MQDATSFALAGTGGKFSGFAASSRAGLVGDDAIAEASKLLNTTVTKNAAGERVVVGQNRAAHYGMEKAASYASDLKLASGYNTREVFGAGYREARTAAGVGAKSKVVGKSAALAGGRLATSVGARFIPVAGQILLAYDIGRFTTKTAGRGARTVAEAYKSFQGGIAQGSFGQGFTDNEVSYTSRQRGVMAISNSRLNARSVLGQEAAVMARHFG